MAEERIFNIFVYFTDGIADSYGVQHHRVSGSDAEKTAHLRATVDCDHPVAKRFALPRTFTPEQWRAAQRYGEVLVYFEQAFQLYRAPAAPVFCLTAVVDGVAKADLMTSAEPFRGDKVSAQPGRGSVPDYLVHYVDGAKLRFSEPLIQLGLDRDRKLDRRPVGQLSGPLYQSASARHGARTRHIRTTKPTGGTAGS